MESEWKIASNLSGGNFLFVLSEQWQILSWPACSKLALVLVAEQSWHLGEELKPWQERRSEGGRERPTGCCTHAATGYINVANSCTSLALPILFWFKL